MKYYLIAGEASGDLHASNLMKALKRKDSNADFRYWGGDLMQQVGGELVKHYKELAFMGFAEVIKNLPTIFQNMRLCKADIRAYRPDVLILVDYSGFNLRIAKWAKSVNQKVFYYISPQVWASRPKRVYAIKENVAQLFTILPFETDFYAQYSMPVNYVGHPLLDVLADYPFQKDFLIKNQLSQPIIALLPGSRRQEIQRVLTVLLAIIPQFPDYQFIIAAAPSIPIAFYQDLLNRTMNRPNPVKVIPNATYDILRNAAAAIVTSGTATLETALLGVPQVVVYKGSWASYQIAKRLITVPYISLVNLIANRSLVKELVQQDLTEQNLASALNTILNPQQANQIKKGYQAISIALGEKGASERTAQLMWQYLNR